MDLLASLYNHAIQNPPQESNPRRRSEPVNDCDSDDNGCEADLDEAKAEEVTHTVNVSQSMTTTVNVSQSMTTKKKDNEEEKPERGEANDLWRIAGDFITECANERKCTKRD